MAGDRVVKSQAEDRNQRFRSLKRHRPLICPQKMFRPVLSGDITILQEILVKCAFPTRWSIGCSLEAAMAGWLEL